MVPIDVEARFFSRLRLHQNDIKEICKRTSLRPAELKQLKLLAANVPEDEKPIENPLVMVLCPSVLAKSLRKPPVKIDRKVIAGLARKMGLVVTKGKK